MEDQLKHVQSLIAKGNLEKALTTLAQIYQGSSYIRNIRLQQARFKAVTKEGSKGVITDQEATAERNKIVDAVLKLVDEIEAVENAPTLVRWFQLFGMKYKYHFLFISLCLIAIFTFSTVQNQRLAKNRAYVDKLDREISQRIATIDIPNWYRVLLVKEIPVDLARQLLRQPEEGFGLQQEFKGYSLNALLEELLEKVTVQEKDRVQAALDQVRFIERKYNNGLLEADIDLVLDFTQDLITFNTYRWSADNQIDENTLISIVDSLSAIYGEIFGPE